MTSCLTLFFGINSLSPELHFSKTLLPAILYLCLRTCQIKHNLHFIFCRFEGRRHVASSSVAPAFASTSLEMAICGGKINGVFGGILVF
jgi:hypothetical protein